MNATRRKELAKALGLIEDAKAIIEQAQSEEQDFYDNMPEGLQSGEKGERAQEVADALQEAVDECDSIIEKLESSVE